MSSPAASTTAVTADPSRRPERRFYSRTAAFGRFGMRIFSPVCMATPHWHGHVELNYASATELQYIFDGTPLRVEADRLVVFWAGIPHQLVGVPGDGSGQPELANIYLPLDSFFFMTQIARLQVALLGGAMVALPRELCDRAMIERWYRDYRSGDFDRHQLVKAELNTLFRRISLHDFEYLRPPMGEDPRARMMTRSNIGKVVRMVRYALENLDKPLSSAEVTSQTGLNVNYALGLFSRTMRLSLKQFIIRMRLVRARGLLLESDLPIAVIAEDCGFTSLSQFYLHFRNGYGTTPHALRKTLEPQLAAGT